MKSIRINISDELHKMLKTYCSSKGITITELLLQSVLEVLNEEPVDLATQVEEAKKYLDWKNKNEQSPLVRIPSAAGKKIASHSVTEKAVGGSDKLKSAENKYIPPVEKSKLTP